jgi:integrase
VLAAVRKFFNWCISRGLMELSPYAGVGAPTRERARYRTLTNEELRAVLQAARTMGHPFGSIVQALVLTGQRRDEVGRLTWDQLRLSEGLWVLPAEHAKNGKPHLVHLSAPARQLIEVTPRLGDLLLE